MLVTWDDHRRRPSSTISLRVSQLTNDRDLVPWILLLNGTSCSGKTTLSRALQHRLSLPRRPFLHRGGPLRSSHS